jgi:hypothetical protein
MADPKKRLHYFNHQFLRADDFNLEQEYHLDMRRRHNRLLHTWGIAQGLEVPDPPAGATAVKVTAGTALDSQGREIVLTEDESVELTGFPDGADVYLTISYHEEPTDPTNETGVEGDTRWKEEPLLEASQDEPDDPGLKLILARVVRAGNIVQSIDGEKRRAAGVVGGDLEVSSLALTDPQVVAAQWPRFQLGAANRADVEGSLQVSGDLNVSGTIWGDLANFSVGEPDLRNDAVTSAKLAEADGRTAQDTNTGAGVKTNHLQDGAVTAAKIADGNVGTAELASGAVTRAKIADNTINELKLDGATRGKLVTNGNNHNHSGGDGAQIRHSTLSKDDGRNPHGTMAADVGALVSVEGVRNPGGNIDLRPSNAITIVGSDAANQITIGENHSALRNNPHGVTAGQVGALASAGGTVSGMFTVRHGRSVGSVATIHNNHASGTTGLLVLLRETSGAGWRNSAVAALSYRSNVVGVYAYAPSGTDALYVSGTSRFTGAKTGYVVDIFINASGHKLKTGDVVKLKGTPVSQFRGDNNKIPVAEVALADKESDNMVIGIVDRESIPEMDAPDSRVEPDDPTFIDDGGELFVVTLGTYAHCKVDATEEPIQVGDLLTSSSNPGHAKKAKDPQIGSIIGKALEPLETGTGYIAVFVNIQ